MHIKLSDFETSTKTIQWEEEYCLQQMALAQLNAHMKKKKKKMRLYPSIIYNTNRK